jgi:formylglycine-generating enzyme required for sulfatase activity
MKMKLTRKIWFLVLVFCLTAGALWFALHALRHRTAPLASWTALPPGAVAAETADAAKRQGEAAKSLGLPMHLSLDLGKGVTMTLALIPAGEFLMGGDTSRIYLEHRVVISKPFYMGIYDVTQEQYQQVMGTNPSEFPGANDLGSKNPVNYVTWDKAVEFCNKMSGITGRTVELPTEAQWEYACRAGTTTRFNTGDTINADQANFNDQQGRGALDFRRDSFRGKSTPVGIFKPNAYGLYDMHGNVEQWCSDHFDGYYYQVSPTTDPQGPTKGSPKTNYYVIRGGGYQSQDRECESAARHGAESDSGTGFRVVVVIEPKDHAK